MPSGTKSKREDEELCPLLFLKGKLHLSCCALQAMYYPMRRLMQHQTREDQYLSHCSAR